MKNNLQYLLFLSISFFSINLFAQEDLLLMLEEENKDKKAEKVIATFKATKVISAQSNETVKAKTLDFRITHRFGNVGTNANGGGHTLWGFDTAENIRFSFDYGITDKLQVGIGRSKTREHLDGSIKYKLLEQKDDNSMPVSVTLYAVSAFSPEKNIENRYPKFEHRLSYVYQAIIARKFNQKISFAVLPSYTHRNFVNGTPNNDGVTDTNGMFSLGVAGRVKVTQRLAIVGDYFYNFSEYRNGDVFYNPLAIGVEIETGGHVFHINLTNASGIIENDFLPNTRSTWTNGGYKMGFNISRVFSF